MPEHRTKLLARQNRYQLNVGTEVAPLWRDLHLRTNQSGSHSATNADTTTDDDEGFPTHIPAAVSQTFTYDGLLGYVNLATGVIDYGQQALMEWADTPGPQGLRPFRIVYADGVGTCATFWASASTSATGGALNDAEKLSYTLTRSGKPVVTTLGAAPETPTTLVGTAGDESVSVAYVVAGSPAAVEVFAYEALTDKEIGYVVDSPATTPASVTGLTNGTAYYFRARSRSATGAISELSLPSAAVTPTA